MAAERKLKAEIDRTLKKVTEGQEVFEEIWNQYTAHKQAHDVDNQNQREKLEGELKKEIKKLQRLREQIKGWIAGADIKDKQPLIDARKSIERDMERFKACEKESKAKGSAAGGTDRDPKQRAKDESRDWINNVVDQLTEKVETMEAEMEELQVTVKKRQKPPARLTALEETVGRHKDHIDRLEKVLRCIDNETIVPEELSDLKEDMDMYLGNEDGEDGGMDVGTVDDLYGIFQDRLDAVDNAAPAAPAHIKHAKGAREKEAEEAREKERERERAAAAAAKAQLIAQGNTNLKLHDDDDRKPVVGGLGGAKSGTTPVAPSPSSAAAASAALPMAVPPLAAPSPAAAAAGAAARQTAPPTPVKEPESGAATPRNAGAPTAPQPPASPSPAPPPPSEPPASPMTARTAPTAGPTPTPAPAGPAPSPSPAAAAATAAAPAGPGIPRAPSLPVPLPAAPQPAAAAAAAGPAANGGSMEGAVPRWLAAAAASAGHSSAAAQHQQQPAAAAQEAAEARASGGADAATAAPGASQEAPGGPGPAGAAGGFGAAAGAGAGPGPASGAAAADALAARLAGVGLGLAATPAAGPGASPVPPVALATQAAAGAGGSGGAAAAAAGGVLLPGELPPVQPAYTPAAAKQILEACFARGVMPQLSDTDWKHSRPRHPVAVPASYPKSAPEVVDNPALFRKMDPECLFFAFYFQPGTHQQFLAAHELKRQSWRFHRHHNAWFQRFTEPAVTSDEFEQGAYVYFDYNIMHDDMQAGWCYRRKENFTFRYDALEDELRVAGAGTGAPGQAAAGGPGPAGAAAGVAGGGLGGGGGPQQTVALAMAQVQQMAAAGQL